MKDYTIVIQQRRNFGESENHSRTIKTNFDLDKNKKLENEIKKIEGIEFCFLNPDILLVFHGIYFLMIKRF